MFEHKSIEDSSTAIFQLLFPDLDLDQSAIFKERG